MHSKLAGRFPLADMVAAHLDQAKTKLASVQGGMGRPSAPPVVQEVEKTASDADYHEKLASALDYAGELLIKQSADSIENGGESRQGGEQLATAGVVGGRQPYKHDRSKHPLPTSSSPKSTKDNPGPATAMDTDDERAPGGNGAKYPANGVLRKTAADSVMDLIQAYRDGEEKAFGKKKEAFAVTQEGHQFDAERAKEMKAYFLNRAAAQQDKGGYTHHDADGKKVGKLGRGLRFNEDGDALGAARHLEYVQKKHEAGKNAYNPLGGTATPLKEEGPGARPGVFRGRYGKVEKKASADLEYILGKVSSSEFHGGGETLDDKSVPVPQNRGRELISSNQAAINAKKVQAKSPRKQELAEVLTEPAMTRSTDSKVHENLRNASNGGVKIAAAKVLLQKIAAEGCTCKEGEGECRYCKMKTVLEKKKAEK